MNARRSLLACLPLVVLAACDPAGSEARTTAAPVDVGAGGGATSTGEGGAGGAASTGTGGATSTGAGGAGGATSTSTSTSTGAGGATTTTSGSGGAGGAATTTTTGSGGAGGAPASGTLLVLAGGVPGSLAKPVAWTAASGWGSSSINLQIKSAALAPIAGGALAVARRLGNDPPAGDDDVFWATWTPGAGFGAVTPLGVAAKGGPAIAPHGAATLVALLDASNKHVFAQHEGGAFGALAPVPAGQPGTQAFGPSGPAVAAYGAAGVWLAYAGDDQHLYVVEKSGPGGAFGGSTLAPTSLVANDLSPAAWVDADDDLHLLYVRKSDGRLCTVARVTPQNTWTDEEVLHPDAISGRAPSAAVTADGDVVVAWRGFDTPGVYFTRGVPGAWSVPAAVEVAQQSASAPTVVAGLGGADAEIVYAADGDLRWARVDGASASAGPDAGVTNVSVVAAAVLP